MSDIKFLLDLAERLISDEEETTVSDYNRLTEISCKLQILGYGKGERDAGKTETET
jgi:hypothetical protein